MSDQRNELAWRGLDLIPEIAAAIHEFGWHATWFVRGDPQIRAFYGSVAHLLETFASTWRKLKDAGDEIGWHPHISYLGDDGSWVSERDDHRFVGALRETYADLRAQGYQLGLTRMGEAAGSNLILKALADLGLKIDFERTAGKEARRRIAPFRLGPDAKLSLPSVAGGLSDCRNAQPSDCGGANDDTPGYCTERAAAVPPLCQSGVPSFDIHGVLSNAGSLRRMAGATIGFSR